MLIYLVCFALSSCMIFASRSVKKKYRKILAFVGLICPILLAGVRSPSLGVDAQVYGVPFFERALRCKSLFDYLDIQSKLNNNDVGFNILVYLVSMFTNNVQWSFAIYEALTIIAIYIGLCNFEKKIGTPVWLGMLLYYFVLYNASYNIMRQTIAVSFVFLAFSYFYLGNKKKTVIFYFLAFVFHSSALVGITLIPMYLYLKIDTISYRKQINRMINVLILFMITIFMATTVIRELVSIGIVQERYLEYLSGGRFASDTGFSIKTFLIQCIYLLIIGINYKYMVKKKMDTPFFLLCSSIVMFFTVFGPTIAAYISRISYYFIPLQLTCIANTSLCFKRENRKIWILIIIVFIFYTWYRTFVKLGYHMTVPYIFYW